ncbi:1950_t:CDS:10 [Paraglomus brasilianum]|uniref:Conserved oligomeric Golgi complex subunit 4 n=1 Tax=Paraglomus brasilianum TaxID=144538 RepID=A0A9N8WSN1_9GLOM|nr:1950_t:CDS:10 [Paraglomus brasilianum]
MPADTNQFTPPSISVNPSELSLSQLQSLTNIDDIQEYLRLLDLEENQVDVDLDALLDKRTYLETELDKLEALRPQLGTLHSKSADLVKIINTTSKVAERISAQVRQLDLEQSRVQLSIKQVEDVQELKSCINGIYNAMQKRDYETAAVYVHRTSTIDEKILTGKFAEVAIPTGEHPDIPQKLLHDSMETLYAIFSREFDTAVQARSESEISRFFRLFPLIGRETEGLDKYSNFVCGIIAGRSQTNLAEDASGAKFYAETIKKLFENIAIIINQHQPVVETHYGPGKMIRVIERLQEECDRQSRIILNSFIDERHVQRKVSDIRASNNTARLSFASQRSNQAKENDNAPDPREIDAILVELATISQNTHLYFQFIRSKVKSELDLLKVQKKDAAFNVDGLFNSSGLCKQLRELMEDYLLIEVFYLRRSMKKAMAIDEYDESHRTSSCVDDVFFVINRCIQRAIMTSDVDVISSFANSVNHYLETDYTSVIHKRLSTLFTSNDAEDARIRFMILLNNLDMSCIYFQRLSTELQQDTLSSLTSLIAEEDIEKIRTLLAWLEDSATGKFGQILESGLDQLFGQTVKPRIRPLLQEAYRDVKYVLEEEEYHELEANDFFGRRFVNGFNSLQQLYKTRFTNNNYNHIMTLIMDSTINMLEKTISATKFNQASLGALRFDKDLRAVLSYFTRNVQGPVRDKFTRLNQISMLLNLEVLSEINDYWGSSSGVTWRLTVAEVKKVLGLRIDFNQQEVANLKQ